MTGMPRCKTLDHGLDSLHGFNGTDNIFFLRRAHDLTRCKHPLVYAEYEWETDGGKATAPQNYALPSIAKIYGREKKPTG